MKTLNKHFALNLATSILFLILTTGDSIAAFESERAHELDGKSGQSIQMGAERPFFSSLTSGTVVTGVYDLSFRKWRNGVLEPVSSLPVGEGPLVLFAHIEDAYGNPAQSGTVDFEFCGNYEPKEMCDAGTARWTRLNRVSIGSCYCKSCGGLPGYDPGPGNACLFVFGTGGPGMEGDDGFRFKYAGRNRSGIDSGMSGAANFTWTAAP